MENNRASKPGRKPKERTAVQFSITLSPAMYDRLVAYMNKNRDALAQKGLMYNDDFNRSGVIALLLSEALIINLNN